MVFINVYIFPETIDWLIGNNGNRIMNLAIDYNVKISLLENQSIPYFKIETSDKVNNPTLNLENCHKVRIIIQKLEEHYIQTHN